MTEPFKFKLFWLLLVAFGLSSLQGCGARPFCLKNIAKSDIDLVADAHQQELRSLLNSLTVKLYRRNPRELRKVGGQTIETRLAQIFPPEGEPGFAELGGRRSTEAITLCFDPAYRGDRVFALVAGLKGMVCDSYNNKSEQFIFDSLDQQKLYNSARNMEILVWRLSNKVDEGGSPFLLTNGRSGEEENLSYERLFGKMIALQDMMARITADKGNRTINRVVHSLASTVFLPVGL